MILFDIIQNNEAKAIAISDYLIKNKYAIQTHIDTNRLFNSTKNEQTIRLFFITKALLYSTIEKEIIDHFYSPEMVIYATPVSHINEAFGELLRNNIKAI